MALPFKTNRISRTFVIEVALYHNEASWNRPGDATPRYWLKPVKLLHVERAGYTYKSKSQGYAKHGHKYWRYKPEEVLTNEQVEEYYEKIKNSYPYGYVEGDIASETKYRLDVKEDQAFQSHYQAYWGNNLDKISLPQKTLMGTLDHEYPYIKFTTNEIVSIKHNVGVVPTLETGVPLYAEYQATEEHYSAPYAWSCYDEDIDVTVNSYLPEYGLDYVFYLNNQAIAPVILSNSGKVTTFNLTSGSYRNSIANLWPTGVGGIHSGIKLAFSTGLNGTWGGHDELTAGLTKYEQKELYTYYVSVAPKEGDPETGHPYYGSGHGSGYVISGEGVQSGPLTLERGRAYYFTQTGSSNSGHPLYVSTVLYTGYQGSGQDPIVQVGDTGSTPSGDLVPFYESFEEWTNGQGVSWTTPEVPTSGMQESGNEGSAYFYLDWSAPDTLYYQSRNAVQVGGQINVVDPASVDGDKPNHVIRLTSTGNKDEIIYYYSPFASGMGGAIYLKKECDGYPVELP